MLNFLLKEEDFQGLKIFFFVKQMPYEWWESYIELGRNQRIIDSKGFKERRLALGGQICREVSLDLSQTSLGLNPMLLLTGYLTLTNQSLNLSVLTCQMGTVVLTSTVELRGLTEKMHTGYLARSGSLEVFRKDGLLLLWLLFHSSCPHIPWHVAAEDSSLSTWGRVSRLPRDLA